VHYYGYYPTDVDGDGAYTKNDPLGTMTYGFDIFDGKLDVIYPSVSQPTPWHTDSFTNKSKW
jgi:hypothetical protein